MQLRSAERHVVRAEGQIAPVGCALAEACDQINFRQGSQLAQRANAPDGQGFGVIAWHFEQCYWQVGQRLRFFASGDHRDSARRCGQHACRMEVGADRD